MMNKTAFKESLVNLLSSKVAGATWQDKLSILNQCVVDLAKKQDYDKSNKGKSWTDEELRVVLQHAPTKANCVLLAYAFKRGYGSIEQIFRWAATSGPEVKKKRPDDAFVHQIKRVAKEVGWRAT